MTVDEIKKGIDSLSREQQDEVSAFLFQLRHATDFEYQQMIEARLNDKDPAHWLTLEEVERRLNERSASKG